MSEPQQTFTPLDDDVLREWNEFRPEGPKRLFCYVPFSALSFSFDGRSLACVYNQKVELGRYPDQSVREMWFENPMGSQLRAHMEHNDLSFGCKHCKYFAEKRKFSGMKPLVFDKYSDYERERYPKVLEFELSNSCNLECVMCNGLVSSAIRKNRDHLPPLTSPYDDEFVCQLEEFAPHVTEAKFFGGEPFLIPIYYKIWDLILDANPKCRIFTITNGTTLNDRIKKLLERGNFDLAVSMDSPRKEALESIRRNADHDLIHRNLAYYTEYCRIRGKRLMISFTLMRINWKEFPRIVEFCNEIGAFLYVSYLKTPPRFALWNLPAGDLADIRRSLEGIEFPGDADHEQSNRRCYEDLLVYLRNAEQESVTRNVGEIILWQSGKEYPVEDWLKEPSTAPMVFEPFEEPTDYRGLFERKVTLYLQNVYMGREAGLAHDRWEVLDEKLQAAMSTLSERARNFLYFYASHFPMVNVIGNLENREPGQIRDQMQQILDQYPGLE